MVLRHGLMKQDIACGISENPLNTSACVRVRAQLHEFTSMEVSISLSFFSPPAAETKVFPQF